MGLLGYRTRCGLAAATAMLLGLAACSAEEKAEKTTAQSEDVSGKTLATVIAADGDLSTIDGALSDAGLSQVFDGAAAYTFLAPTDAAFAKLAEAGADLRTPEQRPAMVAVLRDHIVPGYLTPADIQNAIKLSDDKSVEMKTMGDHTLTFTGSGDAITVTSEDGAKAHFAGDALQAGNGVAIPIDGLLKTTSAPAQAAAQ
jgi:uncharacterized surface protein with fasciclin (FAS1) repeats